MVLAGRRRSHSSTPTVDAQRGQKGATGAAQIRMMGEGVPHQIRRLHMTEFIENAIDQQRIGERLPLVAIDAEDRRQKQKRAALRRDFLEIALHSNRALRARQFADDQRAKRRGVFVAEPGAIADVTQYLEMAVRLAPSLLRRKNIGEHDEEVPGDFRLRFLDDLVGKVDHRIEERLDVDQGVAASLHPPYLETVEQADDWVWHVFVAPRH